MVRRHNSEHFLGNQQKSSDFSLAYHHSLFLFIFFCLQVYIIENECLWEEKTCQFFYFLFYFIFFIFFANSPPLPPIHKPLPTPLAMR